jgi:group I intron endonuclease
MKTGVYRITCKLNGKSYIGSTAKSFKERWDCHRNLLRKKSHHSRKLQNSWNKYGEDNFEFVIILYCNPEDAVKNEQRCFDELKPALNMAPIAGSLLGMKQSEKTKKAAAVRMRARARKHYVRGEWLSVLELSEKYEIDKATLHFRVKRGELGEMLIAPQRAPNTGKGRKFLIRGEWLDTQGIMKKYDLAKATVQNRIRDGLRGEDLIAPPLQHGEIVKLSMEVKKKKYRRILVKGEKLTVSEIADKYGISQYTIEGRLYTGVTGDDLVKPVKKMNNDTAKRHLVRGERLTVKEISKKYNVSEVTTRGRLREGWTGDELALPAGSVRPIGEINRIAGIKRAAKRFIIFGESLSVAEMSEKYGLSKNSIQARIDRGVVGDALVAPLFRSKAA